ncbi:hypothetical protein E2C01_066659 [Portunus trituberculatus]|uniref:Uncharacterized protein n=1 Tax=Portunus trituberculatus TaxID=210409 RepID=A0A5B7HR39_PORTR|nr:hypothetical protein [Portunus trituberculatus]
MAIESTCFLCHQHLVNATRSVTQASIAKDCILTHFWPDIHYSQKLLVEVTGGSGEGTARATHCELL